MTSGSVSVEPSGELAVYPGSVLHLECLHARSQGEPEWSWTSTYRTYPTGNFLLNYFSLIMICFIRVVDCGRRT